MTRKWIKNLAVVTIVVIVSCAGLDTFDVHETSSATVAKGTPLEQLAGDMGFDGLLGFDLSQNQTLQNEGVERHEIDSVRLKRLRLTVTSPPSGQDLTFIDNIQFFVEAGGLPRKLIAEGGPFDSGATVVDLVVKDVELASYVAASAMDITTEADGHRPAEDTTIRADVDLVVDVNVDGALCR